MARLHYCFNFNYSPCSNSCPPLPCSALPLDKLQEYRGTLAFVMNVDGVERNFSFAVKMYMTVNSPSRNRHSDIAVAVIVLKAEQAASVVNR